MNKKNPEIRPTTTTELGSTIPVQKQSKDLFFDDLHRHLREALEESNEYMLEDLELEDNPSVDTLLKSLNVNLKDFERFESDPSNIKMCAAFCEALNSQVKLHNHPDEKQKLGFNHLELRHPDFLKHQAELENEIKTKLYDQLVDQIYLINLFYNDLPEDLKKDLSDDDNYHCDLELETNPRINSLLIDLSITRELETCSDLIDRIMDCAQEHEDRYQR